MPENICRFIPGHSDNPSLQVIHFVQKNDYPASCEMQISAEYRLYYVYGGKGVLRTKRENFSLGRGDLFFTMPSLAFCLASTDNLQCMYISFLGERSYMLMDKLRITSMNHLFHGYECIEPQWLEGIRIPDALQDLRSEGILLYTFSVMASRLMTGEESSRKQGDICSPVFRIPATLPGFLNKKLGFRHGNTWRKPRNHNFILFLPCYPIREYSIQRPLLHGSQQFP